ncbi:FAD/NAD(P)-binding protein [Streptomyces apocyni]|uniref:FAD/NAD(P)-binding protein n=1 Tax=Streptomyces apocyni TaxID=2654677 RepID=UPI0012EA5D34|nr:FAD/NAD(P)-binding protein [Streptomyces apocyni]
MKDEEFHRIAVVGGGPRGLSVVERLAARLTAAPPAHGVEIWLIDPVQVGSGRVWRTDQPDWFLMNTVADEVSSFSGQPDGGPSRPGAGPSLAQWWQHVDADYPGPNSYAPRALHGRYMQFVLESVENHLPDGVLLHRVAAEVLDLTRTPAGRYELHCADGHVLDADRVVLTTGHAVPEPAGSQRELADFAAGHPSLTYIQGDSAADMPLDHIAPGTRVGVLGLGLSFYDVMASLTVGRGGTFAPDADGSLVYRPSGAEPVIVAGSRSGMPLPARGRNEKHHDYRYTTLLFTEARVRAGRTGEQLDFVTDVLPWLLAEVDLAYYATELTRRGGDGAAAFVQEALAAAGPETPDGGELRSPASARVPDVRAIALRHGVGSLPPLVLENLARPFAHRRYTSPGAFATDLLDALRTDLAHAEQGNVGSPVKAALDVLRDTRSVVRALVDFSGLTPASHRTDFLGWYVPRSSFLAAGPPRERLQQVRALLNAGCLRIVGPAARYETDPAGGRFRVSSPQVKDSEVLVETMIDARIPTPSLHHDPSALTRSLVEQGILTSYVNGKGPDAFDTGGVHVTGSPFHPVGRDGLADTGLYVLGIPTEHTRWFMQGGSSRPGFWTDFVQDADAIAADALLRDPVPDAPGLPAREAGTGPETFVTEQKAQR